MAEADKAEAPSGPQIGEADLLALPLSILKNTCRAMHRTLYVVTY